MLIITPDLRIPLREFHFTFARSGGPGGQNVNKVNSKATLRWPVAHSPSLPDAIRQRLVSNCGGRMTATGDLLVTSQRFRDAGRNVADCLEKLRRMIADAALPPKPRRPTRRSRGSVERRLQEKRHRGARKQNRRISGEA
jgi:ribosome-associated protein